MWYEVLPCIGVMFSAMTLGMLGTEFVPWVMFGNRHYRDLNRPGNIAMFHRDERLEGMTACAKGAFYPKGLEMIPDEEPKQSDL